MTKSSGRRPRSALLWGAGAGAALILVLSTNGTLGAWTTAVIGNSDNSVTTATAVVLRETSGANTCRSDSSPSNVSTCTTINKYGGTASPLGPGTSRTIDVTFTNVGAGNATSFKLEPGVCTSTPATGTPTPTNLCTAANELTVAAQCSPGATFTAATAWTDLAYPAAVPPTATKSHTAAAGDLNAGASWTCRFTVALDANASINSQNLTVSQPLTWTLTK